MAQGSHALRATGLRLDDIRDAFRLIGEVRERGDDPGTWQPYMLEALNRKTGAVLGMSAALRPPLASFEDVAREPWRTFGWIDQAGVQSWERYLADAAAATDPLIPPFLRVAARGRPFVRQRVNLLDDAPWYRSEAVGVYRRASRVDHCAYSAVPLPRLGRLHVISLHRAWGDKPFTVRDTAFVKLFHAELARLWQPGNATPAPAGSAAGAAEARTAHPLVDLPPHLRRVLDLLCANLSEKQVAARLGLSRHTVHGYAKELHRRFGVATRGELVSRVQFSRAQFVPRLDGV